MNRWPAAVVLAAAILVIGCDSGPPEALPETPPPTQENIVALQPRDMAEQVTHRPTFSWKLPPKVASPALVSFTLAEAGNGDQPIRDQGGPKRVAFASGLHTKSPNGFDPWEPPPGCVLTGEVTDMKQLKANTWYRWSVRAASPSDATHADFYFRTRAESATPAP
jgi:hypothetical protein